MSLVKTAFSPGGLLATIGWCLETARLGDGRGEPGLLAMLGFRKQENKLASPA
jgi:hypothetical protein